MAKTKIDILTPIPNGKDFNTIISFIPATLMVMFNGQVWISPRDFMEYGTNDGFRLNFTLPGNANSNNDSLIAIYQVQDQSGITLQETLRKVDEETRFQFIARSGLTDVNITIYDNIGNTKVVDNATMTEKDNDGVYEYNFTPTALGTYTAVMKESTDYNIQVTEIIVIEANLQDVFEIVTDIRTTQVLGKPKIIIGDSC